MYTERTDKPASQWTVQDIEARVGFEEGSYLEFKKATEFLTNGQYVRSKLVEELVETASAFLNADGGTILLGVQTDLSADDRRVEYLKPPVGWEWPETLEERGINQTAAQVLEIINSNLSPRPFGIQVNQVQVSVGDMLTGVTVVTVPASQMGAHQSLRTHRYYRRIGDADMPMADYEIRDVNSRRLGPLLSLRMFGVAQMGELVQDSEGRGVTRVNPRRFSNQSGTYYEFILMVRALNSGKGTAHAARFDLGLPASSSRRPDVPESGWFTDPGQASMLGSNIRVIVPLKELSLLEPRGAMLIRKYRLQNGVSEERVRWSLRSYQGAASECHPIWPSIEGFDVGQFLLRLPIGDGELGLNWVPWRCIAENMPEIRGVAFIVQVDGMAYVGNFGVDTVSWAGESEDEKFQELKGQFGV